MVVMEKGGYVEDRVYIKDGILYNVYSGKVNIGDVVNVGSETLKLLDSERIYTIPVIVILGGESTKQPDLKLSDFSKLFHLGVLTRFSGVWTVGSTGILADFGKIIGDTFLGGRLHNVESVETAVTEIKKSGLTVVRNIGSPIEKKEEKEKTSLNI